MPGEIKTEKRPLNVGASCPCVGGQMRTTQNSTSPVRKTGEVLYIGN